MEFVSKAVTKGIILPGGYERVSVSYPKPQINTDLTFSVSIDESGLIEECNIENNSSPVSESVKCEMEDY